MVVGRDRVGPTAAGPTGQDRVERRSGGLGAYRALLRRGDVLRPFAASLVARLPISMAPLSIVLLVQHARGSYAPAGLVSAVFALGIAAGSPLWGRAMDRYGQRWVVVPTAVVSAAGLAGLALGADAGAPVPALVALAAGSGAAFPPFSAAMRGTWRARLADPALRRAGFAVDAAAVESIFVVGPLLVSLLLVATPPAAPLLVTAGLLAGGGLLYAGGRAAAAVGGAAGRSAPRARAHAPARGASAEPLRGVLAVLAVSTVVAVAFGLLDTSLAATARSVLHDQGRLGLLFAAVAGGSTIGGLAYGAAGGHGAGGAAHEVRRLPLLLGVFAVGLGIVALLLARPHPPLVLLLVVLFALGLSISPSLIIEQAVVDRLVPPERSHEAQAWLSTSVMAGAAAGAGLAGVLVQAGGAAASFATAASAGAVAAAVSLAARGAWGATARARTAGPAGPGGPGDGKIDTASQETGPDHGVTYGD